MIIKRVQTDSNARLAPLRELAQPVSELFYAGNLLELLCSPIVAIVGSRKISAYGQAITSRLAADLASTGVVVMSGLALGVDSVAHRAVVDAGGKTIAVLPAGLDQIYPSSHHQLARRILEQGGALISEYKPGAGAPQKYQFIARNRIIAALSQGVLITEAATKSGSLHTANFALERGIEVFAVPGNITSPTSAGTNELIKTGATPVTSVADVLEPLHIASQTTPYQPNDAHQQIIYKLLLAGVQDGSELMIRSGMPPAVFQQTISMMEITGAIRQFGNSSWIIS